jgi:hypothetical protein
MNLTYKDVELRDYGTLDTVVSVQGYEYTYSPDFVSGYRPFTIQSWKEFAEIVLSNHCEEVA